MPRALLILDSVAAAQDLLMQRPGASDAELLCTHYSVVGFLGARGITCRDVTDFISVDAAGAAIRNASADLDEKLTRLDETVGASMCAAAGLPRLALFHASFKYLGQYNLSGRRCFEQVLADRLAESGARAVEFHHALATSNDPVFSFVDAAGRVCKERGVAFAAVAVVSSERTRRIDAARGLWQLFMRALRAPDWALVRVARRLRRKRRPNIIGADPVVLLFDPPDDSFFESALSGLGVQLAYVARDGVIAGSERLRSAARPLAARMKVVLEEWLRMQPPGADNELERRCVSQIARNAAAVLEPIALAHQFLQSQPITAAAWDVPLITRPPLNLLAELFLNSGVQVLGRQHGANYVDQRLGAIHFDSDFNRCTHYFSYGFGPQEFAAAYPGARHRCSFTPAGNTPRVLVRRRKSVDIVFPITNCVPLYYLARMPESELVRRQAGILEAMEARQDLDCVVKPPPGFSANSFAHVESLARLRNVRVVCDTWTEYLSRRQPRLVVFETASTPLFEVLPLDVDIFLMLDPLFPFTEPALAMLHKRVHIFATVDELADAIRRYGLGTAARLRDSTYYDTYVNRGCAAAVANLLAKPAFTPDCNLRSMVDPT